MSTGRYSLLLVVAFIVGLLGGALSSPLVEYLLPQKLLPKYMRARRGFEIIDKHGKLSVRLDKEGLAFFDDNGEQSTLLSPHGVSFVFNTQDFYRSVQIDPTNPCLLTFTQNPPAGFSAVLPSADWFQPQRVPKLGCGTKDGKVIWEVP